MKRSERTYDQLFGLLRDTSPATSFTTEEVRSLIEESSGDAAPRMRRFAPMPRARRIAILAALLAVTVAGVGLLRTGEPAGEHATTSVGSAGKVAGTASTPPAGETPADPSIDPGNAGAPRSSTHTTIQARESAVERPTRHLASPSHTSIAEAAAPQSRARETVPSPPEGASSDFASSPSSPPQSPPPITTLPMLELTPEELKSLGVTFADGGIQTTCEEYYTLTTEQERATFAQMGMDTTKRSGIVRMRLSIDTFDLTTKKHGWTRVDDYSRVAPVIALNSYVRDDHYNTVFVASFKRSPIMASARRSIDSMVTFLPEALASGNVDRVMHDSDQANPARILVPVHIRLGDAPIIGSTKRWGTDIILWYYPTPEFAAALPARYRTSLQRELNVLADVVECNLPQREACRQITGEPLLVNYCRRTSGALSALNVSPNPAHGEVRVRYMLESQRAVMVSLYGIRGEYIRELVPATSVASGLHSENVQLGDVRPGAYTIVLRSDQGEQVSERLIVQ